MKTAFQKMRENRAKLIRAIRTAKSDEVRMTADPDDRMDVLEKYIASGGTLPNAPSGKPVLANPGQEVTGGFGGKFYIYSGDEYNVALRNIHIKQARAMGKNGRLHWLEVTQRD